MTRMAQYELQRKKKFLGLLEALHKEIKSGRLVVQEYGVWDSRMGNGVNFKFYGVSRDSEKLIKKLSQFS